jgi:hypothetical protein
LARFYSDENFPLPAVLELRRPGHDVLTSIEAGQANQKFPDDQFVHFAAIAGRAVLTLNRRHFAQAHRRSSQHAGIVTCTVDADYVALARRVDEAVANVPDLNGVLIRIVRP